MVKPFLQFFDKITPSVRTGCPFEGTFNLSGWEMDKEAATMLPSVMPEGDFILVHRFHTADNHTLINSKFSFEIRPIGTAELIKLG